MPAMKHRAPSLLALLVAGSLGAPSPPASAMDDRTLTDSPPALESTTSSARPERASRPLSIRGREPENPLHRASPPGSLGPTLTLTVLLLAVAGATAWFVRRTQLVARTGNDAAIRLIARAGVAPRQGIVLVQIGSERLVLGVGGQGPPTLLARWPEAGSESTPS